MKSLSILAFAAVAIATGCAQGEGGMATLAVDTAAAKAGMDSTRMRYSELQKAGDAAGLAGLYTTDATLDIYGVPRTKGRAAIQAALQTDFGMRKFTVSEITPVNTEVRSNEDGSEIGTYHDMHDVNGAIDHEWGRYVVGLHKDADGVWRLTYVMAFPDSTKADKK